MSCFLYFLGQAKKALKLSYSLLQCDVFSHVIPFDFIFSRFFFLTFLTFFSSSNFHIFICSSCLGHGMVKTLRSIYREAGVGGLYAGLPVTMLIAVPANVLYFATYESLRDTLQPRIPNSGEDGREMLFRLRDVCRNYVMLIHGVCYRVAGFEIRKHRAKSPQGRDLQILNLADLILFFP